jgi:hypothetical protein
MTPMTAYEPEGSWDSIHVFETAERGRQAHYKLTSTVMLQLLTRKGTDNDEGKKYTDSKGPEEWKREGEVSLSGSMSRQVCGIVAPGHSYIKLFLDNSDERIVLFRGPGYYVNL